MDPQRTVHLKVPPELAIRSICEVFRDSRDPTGVLFTGGVDGLVDVASIKAISNLRTGERILPAQRDPASSSQGSRLPHSEQQPLATAKATANTKQWNFTRCKLCTSCHDFLIRMKQPPVTLDTCILLRESVPRAILVTNICWGKRGKCVRLRCVGDVVDSSDCDGAGRGVPTRRDSVEIGSKTRTCIDCQLLLSLITDSAPACDPRSGHGGKSNPRKNVFSRAQRSIAQQGAADGTTSSLAWPQLS